MSHRQRGLLRRVLAGLLIAIPLFWCFQLCQGFTYWYGSQTQSLVALGILLTGISFLIGYSLLTRRRVHRMVRAAQTGDTDTLQTFLNKDPLIELLKYKRKSLLELAREAEQPEVVALLEPYFQAPAMSQGKFQMLVYLCMVPAVGLLFVVSNTDAWGRSLLKATLALGGDLDSTKGLDHVLPLAAAMDQHNVQWTRLLLEYGADPFHPSPPDPPLYGFSPMEIVLINDDLAGVQQLLRDAQPVYLKQIRQRPLLHTAQSPATARLLLKHGADVHSKDPLGMTPLHWASTRALPLVTLLVAHGADIHARDNLGKTPLHFAAKGSRPDVAAFLLDHGAELEARDKEGETPLILAAHGGDETTVSFFLEQGASVHAYAEKAACERYSPLHAAVGHNRTAVVKLLLEHGADVNLQGPGGCTPLDVAEEKRPQRFATLLRKHGAQRGRELP